MKWNAAVVASFAVQRLTGREAAAAAGTALTTKGTHFWVALDHTGRLSVEARELNPVREKTHHSFYVRSRY